MSNITNKFVFEKCLSLVSMKNLRCAFTDTYSKKLLTGHTILLFVSAYLQNLTSLQDISDNLSANKELQSFLGLESISGSTVCRKLDQLPTRYLQSLCLDILNQVAELKKPKNEPDFTSSEVGLLGILDSTEIKLPKKEGEWAYTSKSKNAVKVHLLLGSVEQDVNYPECFIPTTAGFADHEIADNIITDHLFTYVMDRGYINYSLFLKWIESKVNFVVRLKDSSKTKILEEYPIETGSLITLDAKVEMKVPKTEQVIIARLVEYKDEKGNKYRVLTNRWDLHPQDVASIYKRRWCIELFFKWIKQNLHFEKLFSYKTTAVWNQIFLSFIAFGLCELVKSEVDSLRITTQQVLKKMIHYWYKPWDKFYSFINRKPTRSTKGRIKKGKKGRPRKHPKILKTKKEIFI